MRELKVTLRELKVTWLSVEGDQMSPPAWQLSSLADNRMGLANKYDVETRSIYKDPWPQDKSEGAEPHLKQTRGAQLPLITHKSEGAELHLIQIRRGKAPSHTTLQKQI